MLEDIGIVLKISIKLLVYHTVILTKFIFY